MKTSFLLLYEEERWRIGRAGGEATEIREIAGGIEAAHEVKSALVQLGHNREAVCLALPSSMTLTASILCKDLPSRQRRNAMLFRLEEQLPLDLESLTADFLPEAGGRALGVAVQTESVRKLLNSLADAGIEVAAICPLTLLAIWGGMEHCRESDYVIVGTERNIDAVRMRGGLPAAWYTAAPEAEDLRRNIIADGLAEPVEGEQASATIIAEPAVAGKIAIGASLLKTTHCDEKPPFLLATRAAAELLAGTPAGWVDLRRDTLAPPDLLKEGGAALRAAIILVLLLPAALTTAMLLRGAQYSGMAAKAYDAQREAFSELYPDRPVPAAVKRYLSSEEIRMRALNGGSGELPRPVSAFETLRRLADALPPKVRVRVGELRIAPGEAFIQGQTLTHGDAEKIRGALASSGFEMEPPRTETLESGEVGFTLTGIPPTPAAEEISESDEQDTLSGDSLSEEDDDDEGSAE